VDGASDSEEEIIDAVDEGGRLADEHPADGAKADDTAAAESKLVKDIRARQAEQEAMKQTEPDAGPAEAKGGSGTVIENESTSAAPQPSGIRMGRLKKTKSSSGVASTTSGPVGAEEMEKLRRNVQTLVKHTGPLGACLDYIQEDIGLMTGELHRWEEEGRKYAVELEEAQRESAEALLPLQLELKRLEDECAEQVTRIAASKAKIARNDTRVQQILRLVSTA
jgi:hypothetical protein